MPRNSLALCVAILVTAAAPSGAVAADQFLGDQTHRCVDFELEVWGAAERRTLFRNESVEILINRAAPVVWFCGRARNELTCHRDANLLEVMWNREGQVYFQCFNR